MQLEQFSNRVKAEGELVPATGSNGAGKSTLLRVAAHLGS